MPVSVLSLSACEGYVCVSPIESDVIFQKTSLTPGVYVIKDILEDEITVHSGGQKNTKSKLVRCLRWVVMTLRVMIMTMIIGDDDYDDDDVCGGDRGDDANVMVMMIRKMMIRVVIMISMWKYS